MDIKLVLIVWFLGVSTSFYLLWIALFLDAKFHEVGLHQWLSQNDVYNLSVYPLLSWILAPIVAVIDLYFLFKLLKKRLTNSPAGKAP